MACYSKPLLMLLGTLVVPLREHHWPPTKRTDIDDSHNNVLLSLRVFRFFFNSNEVISLFCEKRQKNQTNIFKIETVSEWESHVVLLLEHQWREKSRSRSWTRQISDKTIVMFYVNCSEKKSSEKKKIGSTIAPVGGKVNANVSSRTFFNSNWPEMG